MKSFKIYITSLFMLVVLQGCNAAIDFVAPGFAVMLIIGAIIMFVLFLIGTLVGLLTSDKDGRSNFNPENLFVVIIFGIFLFGIFGDGCN